MEYFQELFDGCKRVLIERGRVLEPQDAEELENVGNYFKSIQETSYEEFLKIVRSSQETVKALQEANSRNMEATNTLLAESPHIQKYASRGAIEKIRQSGNRALGRAMECTLEVTEKYLDRMQKRTGKKFNISAHLYSYPEGGSEEIQIHAYFDLEDPIGEEWKRTIRDLYHIEMDQQYRAIKELGPPFSKNDLVFFPSISINRLKEYEYDLREEAEMLERKEKWRKEVEEIRKEEATSEQKPAAQP